MSKVVDLLLKTCTDLGLRVGIGQSGKLAIFGKPADIPPRMGEMLRRYRAEVCQRLQLIETAVEPSMRLFVPECPGECPGIGDSRCCGCPMEVPKPKNWDMIDPHGVPTRWTCRKEPASAT